MWNPSFDVSYLFIPIYWCFLLPRFYNMGIQSKENRMTCGFETTTWVFHMFYMFVIEKEDHKIYDQGHKLSNARIENL